MKVNNTVGKYVFFIDKNSAYRINKVVSVHGNTITTQDAVGGKERIHPETTTIFGIVSDKKGAEYEPIEFKEKRIGRKIKNKIIVKEIRATEIAPLSSKKRRVN